MNFSTHRLQTDPNRLKSCLSCWRRPCSTFYCGEEPWSDPRQQFEHDSSHQHRVQVGFYHIHTLVKIRKYLTPHVAKTLVQAMVLSRLNYANSLFAGLPKEQILRRQRVQNAAARLIVGARRFDPVSLSVWCWPLSACMDMPLHICHPWALWLAHILENESEAVERYAR